MERTMFRVGLFLILVMAGVSAVAQQASTQVSVSPKPPDMVCFGYGPKWSIQFINGEARYLGINQPDQSFLGDFTWVPEDKTWVWQRANGLAPMNGSFGLSATVQKASCSRSSSQANLSVLVAGEFADRRHGQRLLPQTAAR